MVEGPAAPAPLAAPELGDGVVTLRVPGPGDILDIVAACQDPQTARWTRVPNPYRRADAESFVAAQEGNRAAGTDLVLLSFRPQAQRPFIGAVGLHGIGHGDAELGYWTAPWARGEGLTQRAVRLAVGHAFTDVGLDRISWCALVGNDASRRLAERVGFRIAGTLRHATLTPGRRGDMWVGDLLPEDLARTR
ncbi:MAG TPA: GNAT family N-acetyltransferase [Candidatus Nanopelagicales bacterium]|jgi:RimJ/RimL family protein N-acetyltransferase|nr:GNAT family N-acetyltransferase [Candidatus Nanopelagicales bacterium]